MDLCIGKQDDRRASLRSEDVDSIIYICVSDGSVDGISGLLLPLSFFCFVRVPLSSDGGVFTFATCHVYDHQFGCCIEYP